MTQPPARGLELSASVYNLFIEASGAGSLPRLLGNLKDNPILTVGDAESYGEQGVMINFYLEQNRVRFEINVESATWARLKVSSQLLKLARIVQDNGRVK